MVPRFPILRMVLIGVAMALLATVAACTGEPAESVAAGTEEALPEWIERVYPPPGAEVASIADIQVEHNLTAPDEQIRLSIDGTDVTVYSDLDTGELVYDVEQGRAPVQLDPGAHTATVQAQRVPEDFDPQTDDVEVLAEFSWEFTLQ